jgi:hypothetical protein
MIIVRARDNELQGPDIFGHVKGWTVGARFGQSPSAHKIKT